LTKTLELRATQVGFAGETGTIWTCRRDGSWTASTVFNEDSKPNRSGKLTNEQLKRLATVLARHQFLALPDQLGTEPDVNPASVSISFGKKQTTCTFDPVQTLQTAKPKEAVPEEARAWDDFIAIEGAVRSLMSPPAEDVRQRSEADEASGIPSDAETRLEPDGLRKQPGISGSAER
jgi:hypothetical protein